jgi:hypothetical protein
MTVQLTDMALSDCSLSEFALVMFKSQQWLGERRIRLPQELTRTVTVSTITPKITTPKSLFSVRFGDDAQADLLPELTDYPFPTAEPRNYATDL